MEKSSVENNKRIAKNTMLLYIRMIFFMLVSLYTSRIILNVLGVDDFGIYNVVGGVVLLFGYLTGTMTNTTQRFLTFELGRGNSKKLKIVFNTCLVIFCLISIIVLIGSVAGVGIISAKIYKVGVLLYGTTPKLGAYLKAIRKA